MPSEIKINTLRGCPQMIMNILQSIADFNSNPVEPPPDFEYYVKAYNGIFPKGIFDYKTNRFGDDLEIYADDELLLSITTI